MRRVDTHRTLEGAMRTRLVVVLAAGVLGTLPIAVTASAAAKRPDLPARTLTTHVKAGAVIPQEGPIEGLALDGTHAAYVKGVPFTRACGLGRRLYRWNLGTGRTSLVSGAKTCRVPDTSTGSGIFAIALTRARSAWIVNSGGNTESGEMLFSSTAKPHQDKVLATSDRYANGDTGSGFAGTFIGGLVSDGSRITYATWSMDKDGNVTDSALWRVSGSKATKIASDSGAVVSASADGGRIALLRADGTLAVYTGAGRLLNTIAGAGRAGVECSYGCVAPGEAVALTSKLIAVLTEAQVNRQAGSIKVYDRTTGELLHTWPAAGYFPQFDAYGGIAVYLKGARLHALDLETGKDVVLARRRHTIEEVRLDRAGLLYFFNGPWSKKSGQDGKLVFVPFETVAAKLDR
jgi:hypothetical protein